MSWDIFVQDLPLGISSVAEIPDDFVPSEVGLRSEVSRLIQALYPEVIVQNDAWMVLALPDCSLEISLGETEPLESFAFHVRGGGSAPLVVAHILGALGLRALDPQSDSGLFDAASASASLEQWRSYRSSVLAQRS